MKKQKTMKQQLNAQFYKGNIPAFCVAAAISIPLGMLNVWVSWLLQVIIDEMTGVPGSLGLRTICLLTVVQITGAAVLLLLRRAAEPRFVRRALRQYKSFAFEKMTEKSMAEFGRENTSGYLSALTNDVNQIEQDYLIQRFVLISNMVTFVGGLALMLWNSPLMTGIVLVLAALPIAVSFLTGSKLTAAQKRVSDRNAGFASLLSDCLNGFAVIKSFRAEKQMQQIFDSENNRLEQEKYEGYRIRKMVAMLGSLSGISTQMGVFLVGAFLAKTGYGITAGQVMLFVNLVSVALQPLSQLPNLLAARRAAIGLTEKLAQMLEKREDESNCEAIGRLSDAIKLKDVSFGYETGKDVLENVSLTLEAGRAYAVVGASGSGKSTLLKLLMGAETGYRGSITVDGHEMANVSRESLYEQISIIQQNVFVFNASIRDNVTMFSEFSSEDVERAIDRAHLRELVDARGMDYACGENGKGLSGGEKQRISIARSLLKRSSILMADEATAALDAATAHQVASDLLDLDGVTRIVVTHALEESLLRCYDGIIALKDGRVAEVGTFDELMEEKGYFYALYTVTH